MSQINKALNLVIKLFDGEYRKNNPSVPFSFHLVDTANILVNYGFGDKVVTAGLLHDCIEHNKLSRMDIQKKFGDIVVEIVDDCSCASYLKGDYKKWKFVKERYLEQLEYACNGSKAVAIADKISNLKGMARGLKDDDKFWDKFMGGRQGQVWFYEEFIKSSKINHAIYLELIKMVDLVKRV